MSMEFFDSTRPDEIPAGSHACLYYDGEFAASAEQAKRFAATRWITVEGGRTAAAHAGVADFEPRNPVCDDEGALREWAEGRLVMDCRARVYTDLANAAAAHARVGDLPNVCYWVACYGPRLTAAQVAAVMREHGADVAEAKVWGLQFAGGPEAAFDTSVLYGAW